MGELSFRACTGTVCVFHVCDQARDNTSQLTAERQLPCRSRGQRSCCAILGSSHTSHLEHTKYFLPSCCWNDYVIFWLKWINCSSYLSSEKVFSIFGCVCTSQWALENILFFLFLCVANLLSPPTFLCITSLPALLLNHWFMVLIIPAMTSYLTDDLFSALHMQTAHAQHTLL